MNFLTKIFLAVFLFLLIFIVLILNTNNYIVPSNDASLLPINSSEGFTNVKNSSIEYTTYSSHESIDSNSNNYIVKSNDQQCFKIEGQNGLACSPNVVSANPIDYFSQAKGSLTCQSYGMSNSKGFLCLNEDQKRLYTTRGGNATGGNGDIGLHVNK